jgi:hypothetical protein
VFGCVLAGRRLKPRCALDGHGTVRDRVRGRLRGLPAELLSSRLLTGLLGGSCGQAERERVEIR